jgi:hypothetical protein
MKRFELVSRQINPAMFFPDCFCQVMPMELLFHPDASPFCCSCLCPLNSPAVGKTFDRAVVE